MVQLKYIEAGEYVVHVATDSKELTNFVLTSYGVEKVNFKTMTGF